MMEYDEAMVEAVALADRLGRPMELVKNYPAGFSVRVINSIDPVRGETINPGTPLTAKQIALRDKVPG